MEMQVIHVLIIRYIGVLFTIQILEKSDVDLIGSKRTDGNSLEQLSVMKSS